jgi:hypothetical protein
MSLYYAQEEAYRVLRTLGSTEGSLAARLTAAFVSNFDNLAAEAGKGNSGLHPSLVVDLLALYEEIQSVEPPNESPTENVILATFSLLDEAELTAIAEQMVLLCVETMQTQGENGWSLEAVRD